MKTYRRLVQNIQNAGKSASYLRGESYTLRLPSGQRCGRPRQRQIIQPDVYKKSETGADFFDDSLRNERFLIVKLQIFEKLVDFIDAHIRKFGNVQTTYGYGKGFLFKSFSAAGAAGHRYHISLYFEFRPLACGFAVAAHEIIDDSFVTGHKLSFETARIIIHRNSLVNAV